MSKQVRIKTMTEVIIETKKFYDKHPEKRGKIVGSGCVYVCSTGNCAVGRVLTSKVLSSKEFIEQYNCSTSVSTIIEIFGIEAFKPSYRIIGLWFWSDLQDFHDNGLNWDSNGITEKGLEVFNNLLLEYKGR